MSDFTAPAVPGFRTGRVLGSGGSSTVWLVTEERTGREFALKCFQANQRSGHHRAAGQRAEGAGNVPEDVIRREIGILSVLDHQHLIKAHDALRLDVDAAESGSAGSGSVEFGGFGMGLLLDYAPGGSLGELVGNRSKLTIGETVTVLTPIAQVLGYLHGKGFTHGDVSPGNVLFTGHGKPMLSDVGIARMVGDVSAVPDHGTPGFVDPTPVDAVRAGLQPERDVYSVAALGWYCLTGEPPRRSADRPPLSLLLPDVPAELAAALEAGLNEDRRLRPAAVEFATAVYRSAPPSPIDLASSVHPTVMPQLVTRRRLPEHPEGAVRKSLRAWQRRMSTSRWSGLIGARQALPFPAEQEAESPRPPAVASGAQSPKNTESNRHTAPLPPAGVEAPAPGAEHPALRGKHALKSAAGGTAGSQASNPKRRSAPARMSGHKPTHGRGTAMLAAGAVALAASAIWAAASFGPGSSVEPSPEGAVAVGSGDMATERAETELPQAVAAQLGAADPLEAVQGLAAVRSLAFNSGRVQLIDLVNVAGSPAFAADARIKAQLQDSGHVLAGFTSTVSKLELEPGSSASRAVVGVTSATSAYEERNASGALVAMGAPAAEQELRLVLVSVDGQWRIADVLPGG